MILSGINLNIVMNLLRISEEVNEKITSIVRDMYMYKPHAAHTYKT